MVSLTGSSSVEISSVVSVTGALMSPSKGALTCIGKTQASTLKSHYTFLLLIKFQQKRLKGTFQL